MLDHHDRSYAEANPVLMPIRILSPVPRLWHCLDHLHGQFPSQLKEG